MSNESPAGILEKYWGYDSFRPPQEKVIRSVLRNEDTLVLMPTGGGKSICYQVPALCREGLCIVVSPLIALMNDQVYQLRKRNVPAAAVHSGMSYSDIDRILDNCIYGQTRLLYLSPERLSTDLAQERISRMNVNLLAVDEAHCISQWGYDFRPAYLEIAQIRELIPDTPLLALTATATPTVAEDIQDKLEFRKAHLIKSSFHRPRLAYVVLEEEGKFSKIKKILDGVPGPSIVYVRSRRGTKEIAARLKREGLSADFYHAGLDTESRDAKQTAWIRGEVRIMVATNAFGMGIDKSNVRSVIHHDPPDSLEAYFQEAGRAGRDGKKAYAILLYHGSDRIRLERQFSRSYPEIEEVKRVYRALGSYFQLAVGAGKGESFDFDLTEFGRTYDLDTLTTYHALRILEQSGFIVLTEAVYVPATLMVRIGKEELYDYLLKNAKLDKLLKTILRTYQGAFKHHVRIREKQLARFLKIS
ncbi:MAG: ATP-dependent DNA helicase RecQ, partial [Saprospiraceae bacterium]|nr:ATP-dependent DNA helicase RecQ [Saprospiraceae bacterium]